MSMRFKNGVMGFPTMAFASKDELQESQLQGSLSDNEDSTSFFNPPRSTVNSKNTYISLIQQYLAMFQVDNATWLSERFVSEYPNCQEGIYLHALCYYRSMKPKTAHYILERGISNMATTKDKTSFLDDNVIESIHYLSAQCSFELGNYGCAEKSLLKDTRKMYKQANTSTSMDDWILQTTPCPVPNGAVGLALLGKIFRKSNLKKRSIKFFRMSLQLDPFLFTSFQSLCELGVNDVLAVEVFGGNPLYTRTTKKHRIEKPYTQNRQNVTHKLSTFKSPLQPMGMSGKSETPGSNVLRHKLRTFPFETPGLTPIAINDSTTKTPTYPHAKLQNNIIHGSRPNSNVVFRACQVAARQYYPLSPDSTPAKTRSIRLLNGLDSKEEGVDVIVSSSNTNATGRSLFQLSSCESHALDTHANKANVKEVMSTDEFSTKTEKFRNLNGDDSISDVMDVLNLLTIAGSVYQCLCQYRCKEALQFLQLLPPHQLMTPWSLHDQGRALLELGDFHGAQRSLECMHRMDPFRMKGLELLSTVYWQLQNETDLANLAQVALDWDLLSPEAHCVAGNCFSLQKDHETALIFFKRSLQLDPNFTYTHTLSGYEYMSNEDFDRAVSCFRQALRIDERHYNAWYGLGAIYHRQEKFDLAEYHFQKAVSLHPSSSVLLCNLGMSEFANGKAYQALDTLSEAFRLDTRNPQARFQRSTIYSALHRPEEALAELKSVCDAAPCEATVHFAMGKVLKRLGRPDEAMRCFLTAMDLDPKDNQLIKSAMDKLDEPDVDEETMTAF